MTKVLYADVYEVEFECYAVRAVLADYVSVYHVGPRNFAFFTKEEAERLANRVTAAGQVDLAHWVGDHTVNPWAAYAQQEAEYFADGRGRH
jgi:hypothetical protein